MSLDSIDKEVKSEIDSLLRKTRDASLQIAKLDTNIKNKILTNIFSKLLDGPDALRKYLLNRFVVEAPELSVLMEDDDVLADFIKRSTVGVWHASCSCRMGSKDDKLAVTDNEGRVYGVSGLRIVDASIFPIVPCANLNFPTLMTAEKIADKILTTS